MEDFAIMDNVYVKRIILVNYVKCQYVIKIALIMDCAFNPMFVYALKNLLGLIALLKNANLNV